MQRVCIVEIIFAFCYKHWRQCGGGNGRTNKKDFIAKMAIASKEAGETRYWLRLLSHSRLVPLDYKPYLVSIENIINVLTKIVKTAQATI